jgi:hypothetical protein
MRMDGGKGEGKEISKRYGVWAYPTLIFLSPDGKVLHRSCKFMESEAFVRLGEDAQDPEKRFAKLMDSLHSPDLKVEFLESFINYLDSSCIAAKKFAIGYLAAEIGDSLLLTFGQKFLRKYTEDINSADFKFFAKNSSMFGKMYGDSLINGVILYSYLYYAIDIAKDSMPKKDERFAKLKSDINASGFSESDKVIDRCEKEFQRFK